MAGAKLVVLYPYPQDLDAFERAYMEDHVPMVNKDKLKGITKFVATKVVGTADGSAPPFYRMAELHFPPWKRSRNARFRQAHKKP